MSLKNNPNVIDTIRNLNSINDVKSAVNEISNLPFISSMLDSFTGKAGIATVAVTALYAGIQKLSDTYNLSYASAFNNTQTSFSEFETEKKNLESLNSELSITKDRINELNQKKASKGLTLTENEELEKLKAQSNEIQRQTFLGDKISGNSQKVSASNASDTLKRAEQSVAQKVAQGVPGGKRTYQGDVDNVNVTDAIKENISDIQTYEKAISDLEKKQASLKPNSKEWKDAQDDIDSYNNAISSLVSDLGEKEPALNTLLKAFSENGDGLSPAKQYKEQFNEVQEALNAMDSLAGADRINEKQQAALSKIWENDSFAQAQQKLVDSFRNGQDITVDKISEQFPGLVAACEAAGISVEALHNELVSLASVEGPATAIERNFVSTTDSIRTATSNLEELKSIMSESTSGSGISFKNVSALRTMFGDDAEKALERTTSGYHINREALADLQKQQEQDTKSGYLDSLNEQYTLLNNVKSQLAKTQTLGGDTSSLELSRDNILSNIQTLRDLQIEYETSSSAFSQWQASLSGGEEGDMFNAINNGKSKADKLNKDGKIGTNEFRSYADLISNRDLSDANAAEIQQAYNDAIPVIEKYFSNGISGVQTFRDEFAQLNAETGEYEFALSDEDIAEQLGIGVEAVEALQRAMNDYGWKTEEDSEDFPLERLKKQAEEAQSYLSEIGDNGASFSGFNLDEDSLPGIDDNIAHIQDYIDSLNDSDLEPELKTEQLENANTILEYLIEKKNELIESGPAEMDVSVDESSLQSGYNTLLDLQKNLQSQQGSFGIDYQGFQAEIDACVTQINSMSPEMKVALGIEGMSIEQIKAGLMDGSIQIPVEADSAEAESEVQSLNNQTFSPKNITVNANTFQASSALATLSSKLSSLKSKTITVTVNRVNKSGPSGLIGSIANFFTGGSSLSGSANLSGHAFSSGSWGVPQTTTALVGERGPEIVVNPYTGNWQTVGNYGAEFTNIPKGSIIFNDVQSANLLKYGRINGRGQAFVSGTFPYSDMPSISYVSSFSGKSNVSSSGNNSFINPASSATEDALKELKDYFDWISVNLKRLKEDTKKTMDAIDTAVGLSAQQAQTSLALSKTQNEMNTARQAYDRYMSHASWFASQSGLSSDLQASVQNGTIDISKYDDDTRSKIKEYQDWYEKARDCLDTIDDLKKQEQKLARRRLENIEDYYDAVIKVNKAMTDTNKAKLKLNEALGDSAISQDVKNTISQSLKAQEDSYKKALQQLSDYQTEFNALVSGGYISKDSDTWYDGQKQLQDFSKKVSESAAALIEFQDQLREVQYTELEQAIDRISRGIDRLKDGISLKDKRDEPVSEEEYLKQLENLNVLIKSNFELRSEKLSEQNLYHVNSEKYQDLAKDISKLDKEIYDSLEDIEKLKDNIVEARLFDFTKNVEEMEALMDETDAFRKLLNNDTFFDKEGMLTGSGLANIALIAQGMGLAKQQIAEYTTGLSKLSELLNNGMLSTEEYEKKQKEYNKAIRDSVFQVEDYKDELLDLYKEQMKQENDALKDNIDLREKARKGMEKYYDYANKVKSQTKDVNALKAQIAALDGVNNASAKAEQKRLKAELAEAENSLAETKRDHENDMISEGYNTLTDSLDKAYDDMNYNLIHNLQFQQEKVAEVLDKVVGSYADAYSTISSIIANTGITGTAGFNKNQADLGTASGSAGQNASASQSQSNVHSSSTAGSITTGGISADHSAIEQELSKEPDITNRKCAELTISKDSVTLEEGKTTSVAVSIRPTDAANKTIAWASSNPAIASVSGGSIKAVKPGSAVISAASTDGSGLSVTCNVTVTKKPEPPKPAPPKVPHSPQGNGVPDVGDRVTFVNGRYYEDSYGQGRRGSWYLGQQVYITSINTRGSHPYHISTGSRLGDGDLGWLKLDQIRGYNSGISHAPAGLGFFDDTSDRKLDLGSEVLITDRGVLKQMDGDTIFSKSQTERLYQLSKSSLPGSLIPQDASLLKIDRQVNQNVNIHIGSLIGSVESVTKETLPELNEILKMAREDTTNYIVQEIKKL